MTPSLLDTLTILQNAIQAFDVSKLSLNPLHIVQWYQNEEPIVSGLTVCFFVALSCWIAGLLTDNYSHVDRLWSIVPPLYVIHFALRSPEVSMRLVVMALISSLWGLRLSYNFARKGGYSLSAEDYRWAKLKAGMHPALWQIFAFIFIAFIQHFILFLIAMPAYAAYKRYTTPLTLLDLFATALFLVLFLGETISDNQQWEFQEQKRKLISEKKKLEGEYADGFLQSGLWAYSRHPNFFCEFSMWWAFYLFSISSTNDILNWTITRSVLLSLLFQGSTNFTEFLSAKKYPKYKIYQQTVPQLIGFRSSKKSD